MCHIEFTYIITYSIRANNHCAYSTPLYHTRELGFKGTQTITEEVSMATI